MCRTFNILHIKENISSENLQISNQFQYQLPVVQIPLAHN